MIAAGRHDRGDARRSGRGPHARLAGRPDPGAARSSSRSGWWRRRSAARRSAPRSSGARPRPPSTGSSAIRSRTARWLYLYDADDDSPPSEYNVVRHAGVTMGLYQAAAAGLPGALRSADRGTEWALDRLLERDGWAALDGRGPGHHGRDRAPGRRADDPPGGHGRHALRRRAAPARALPASLRPSRRARCSRRTTRRAGRRCPASTPSTTPGEAYWALARLHRAFPGEALGRGRGPHRRLPGDVARRGRGSLAADPRSLGRLRHVRDRGVPRARPPAAHRGRGRLRAPPSRAVRRPGPVGQPAVRALGPAGAGQRRAPWRRLRRDRRGSHRAGG